MRILFIGPLPEPITGQSLACQVLLEELKQHHLVDVININKSSLKSGVAGGRLGRVLVVLGFVWQAWRLSRHCDIVYFTISESVAGNLKDLLIYCACAGRLSGMAVHLHGGAGMKVLLRDKPLLAKLNRYCWKRMGAVILLGQRHLPLMNGLPDDWRKQYIHLIPNFAQAYLFRRPAEIDAKFRAPGPLRIVFLSNMIPDKGHEELFAAYCSLNTTEQSQIQLEFAGAFESIAARDAFLNRISKTPQVSYHGVVGGASKANFLGQAHVFCLPTYYPYEGQPISILEAFASGCAVITTDHSGIFDVFVPGICGLAVEPQSVKSLAAALRRCLADRAKLHAQAHNNRQLAYERYRVTTYTSRLLLLLSKLAAPPKQPTAIARRPMPNRSYQICTQCIMDTTDQDIVFDDLGCCEYCNNFDATIKLNWDTGVQGQLTLQQMGEAIRADGMGRDFDCIIGLSGGLDSSYAAYIAKEKMGLRPLLFHVDAGWNTDQAVGNIEKLVDGLGLDLYTDVVNWEAVKRMQVAFLYAGIPDQDLVQDAAFFSGLYKFAQKYKIKRIITGSNFSTECCREPEEWGGYLGIDKTLFKDIWAKCGDGRPNDEFPLVDILVYKLWYQKVLGMKVYHPLNLVPYIKKDAEDELECRFGWQRFQHKHHESRFTRFYEDYWLPRRFGFEKRRAHFSSLIMTGQMTREEALDRISRPEMDEHFLQQEFEYVAHKLGLTVEELQELFESPKKTYRDYKNKRWMIGLGANILRWLGLEKRYFR